MAKNKPGGGKGHTPRQPPAKPVSPQAGFSPMSQLTRFAGPAGIPGALAQGAQGVSGLMQAQTVAGAAGPIGAVVAAAQAVEGKLKEMMRSTVQAGGQAMTKAAAMDASVFGDAVEAGAKHLGFFGDALSEGIKQARGFSAALDKTSRELGQYHGGLAVANAMADVRQTLGDLRRAQLLGTDLARFRDASSRFENNAQDVLARAAQPLIGKATTVLDGLSNWLAFAESFMGNPERFEGILSRIIQAGVERPNIPTLLEQIADILTDVRRQGDQKEQKRQDDARNMFNAILRVNPQPQPGDPGLVRPAPGVPGRFPRIGGL